ncbi:hypothetical protein FEDK69T_31560 [Flavobacterium enshiense DK69]|nr:hypothetical protein FEDK69T_31560 [Flavobacterium enshiense DK69]
MWFGVNSAVSVGFNNVVCHGSGCLGYARTLPRTTITSKEKREKKKAIPPSGGFQKSKFFG